LEVGAEEEFKLDLRQDRDSGKQKLKGAVRTETHRRHYWQHPALSSFVYLTCHISTLKMAEDELSASSAFSYSMS
jgi:hypothetical protein